MEKIPTIIIYGPTSSGKTELAIYLAKKLNGEVVSADSRQVYKKINIASGKVTKTEMKNIKHHLIDIKDPRKQTYSAWEFVKDALEAISNIHKKGKIPIVAGGTMFYISALLKEMELPNIGKDEKLRKKLEQKSYNELIKKLEKLNPDRAKKIEKNNKRRLIRALEIEYIKNKKGVKNSLPNIEVIPLKLGILVDKDTLKEKIHKRVEKRIRTGMVKEAKDLHKWGLSYKKMRELGLEMRHLADYLQNKIDKEELVRRIKKDAWNYARKQISWWKKDKNIIWIPLEEKDKFLELAKNFINKNNAN